MDTSRTRTALYVLRWRLQASVLIPPPHSALYQRRLVLLRIGMYIRGGSRKFISRRWVIYSSHVLYRLPSNTLESRLVKVRGAFTSTNQPKCTMHTQCPPVLGGSFWKPRNIWYLLFRISLPVPVRALVTDGSNIVSHMRAITERPLSPRAFFDPFKSSRWHPSIPILI